MYNVKYICSSKFTSVNIHLWEKKALSDYTRNMLLFDKITNRKVQMTATTRVCECQPKQ